MAGRVKLTPISVHVLQSFQKQADAEFLRLVALAAESENKQDCQLDVGTMEWILPEKQSS